MMNIDQARAGGEGIVSKKKEDDDKPSLFQTEESKLKIAVPEGWSVKEK